jgi:hypothetical protein
MACCTTRSPVRVGGGVGLFSGGGGVWLGFMRALGVCVEEATS